MIKKKKRKKKKKNVEQAKMDPGGPFEYVCNSIPNRRDITRKWLK